MHLQNAILWEKLFRRRRPKRNLTKSIAATVIILFEYIFGSIYKQNLDNLTYIMWDEAFLDDDGVLKWCSRPKVAVPVPLTPDRVDIKQQPFLLISSPSSQTKPYLKAEALDHPSKEVLCQIPDQFFEQINC